MCTVTSAKLNFMINACIQDNNINNARKLFDENPSSRNLVSWNMMMTGYVKHHQIEYAQHLFYQMPFKDTVSWNIMLSGFHRITNSDGLYHCFLQMEELVWPPMTIPSPRAYASLRDEEAFKRAFDDILAKDVTSWNALVSGYMEVGSMDDAQTTFDMMPERNIISWTTLVNGYIRNKRINKARSVFNKMSERNVVS
ncbi:hypothetical protein AAZX31_03G203900 [Glycine max]